MNYNVERRRRPFGGGDNSSGIMGTRGSSATTAAMALAVLLFSSVLGRQSDKQKLHSTGKKTTRIRNRLVREDVGAYSTAFLVRNVKARSASGVLEQIGPLLESSEATLPGHTPASCSRGRDPSVRLCCAH